MIVITGSESFVGQELIKQCIKEKIAFLGIDLIDKKNPEYPYQKADIRKEEIFQILPENTDVIIHLAALSRDSDCKGNAYDCFDINVMGTLNLIKIAKRKNVKQFIFASSEWVYNEFLENEEKDENGVIDIARINSEYALSKIVSENNLKQEFQNEFGDITILRFGIIYGPRKNNWSAVESIFNQIKNNDEITVGSLKNGRRFIHVSDIADGIIKSIGLKGFNILNLSGDEMVTIEKLINKSQEICGKKVSVIENNPTLQNIRNPSNHRAKEVLGWQPKTDIVTGLKTLVDHI